MKGHYRWALRGSMMHESVLALMPRVDDHVPRPRRPRMTSGTRFPYRTDSRLLDSSIRLSWRILRGVSELVVGWWVANGAELGGSGYDVGQVIPGDVNLHVCCCLPTRGLIPSFSGQLNT